MSIACTYVTSASVAEGSNLVLPPSSTSSKTLGLATTIDEETLMIAKSIYQAVTVWSEKLIPKNDTTYENNALPRSQKNHSFFLSPAMSFRADPSRPKQREIKITKHANVAKPPDSASATNWLAWSHMSQPQLAVSFTPTSHQSLKWRIH